MGKIWKVIFIDEEMKELHQGASLNDPEAIRTMVGPGSEESKSDTSIKVQDG